MAGIQNEECVGMALYEGREFVIPCVDAKDAHSKRVSLYNVKRRLSVTDQKKVRIQKEKLGDGWVVRVSPEVLSIMEVVDGKLVSYEGEERAMSQGYKEQIVEMLKNDYTEEEIVDALTLKGLNKSTIIAEIAKAAL